MDLKELSKIINDFQMERGWTVPDPNQMVTSVVVELGELVEHYQWKDSYKELTEEKKKEIAFEFVDVLFYLLAIAHRSGITNLEPYFKEKLKKLAIKYPAGITMDDYYKKKKEYRETGKNKTYD